ncbi:hypothetical protein ACP70R_011400 [Stipagrostis hirtigluma subsp. patula]
MEKLEKQQAAAAHKKLRRLDMLLVKIHSAVEASEKRSVENSWTGSRKPPRRATKCLPASGRAGTPGFVFLLCFCYRREERSVLVAHAAGHPRRRNRKTLFSTDEDMERLNNAVERLEELSPEIGDFIKLLKLEIRSPEPKPGPTETTEKVIVGAKRARPSDSTSDGGGFRLFGFRLDAREAEMRAPSAPSVVKEVSESKCPMAAMPMNQTAATDQEARRRRGLVDRLEEAFAAICRAVELADCRDLGEHEWLAYWASVLREAKGHGCAVLAAICAGDDARAAAGGEAAGRGARESRELRRFVRGMESLASDVGYFAALACLCPAY